MDEVSEHGTFDKQKIVDLWQKASGLHTVEEWVVNYNKHPAGWGALLMIHGTAEVTARLRSKVQNYAMYAVLFLACSLTAALEQDPQALLAPCLSSFDALPKDAATQLCGLLRRLFFYAIVLSAICHMLTIMLAMAFVNALNETARDADVYRMFARGKGFIATVKVEDSFRYGIYLAFCAIAIRLYLLIGIDVLIVGSSGAWIAWKTFQPTSALLFKTASIVKYWRKEKGGNPDEDDPYDLAIPVERFKQRAHLGRVMMTRSDLIPQ